MAQPLTLRECLALAVELERAGALFYARMANELAGYAPVRELLLSLSDDERVHEDQFEALRGLAPIARGATSVTGQHLRALAVHRFFSGPQAPLRPMAQARAVHQVLSLALDFERATLQAFEQLRDSITGEAALDLLDKIIETERVHVLRVQRFVR